jgi:hypothetical protein
MSFTLPLARKHLFVLIPAKPNRNGILSSQTIPIPSCGLVHAQSLCSKAGFYDYDHQDRHSHHDSGNHSHEPADRLKMPVFSNLTPSLRRPVPFAGENPRSFRYRLDRPPKLYKIV